MRYETLLCQKKEKGRYLFGFYFLHTLAAFFQWRRAGVGGEGCGSGAGGGGDLRLGDEKEKKKECYRSPTHLKLFSSSAFFNLASKHPLFLLQTFHDTFLDTFQSWQVLCFLSRPLSLSLLWWLWPGLLTRPVLLINEDLPVWKLSWFFFLFFFFSYVLIVQSFEVESNWSFLSDGGNGRRVSIE